MKAAIISFGSNLGDLGRNLARARECLEERAYTIRKCSHVYLTPALGFDSENDFYNAIVEVLTNKGPEDVLHDLLQIEQELGRIRYSKSYKDRIIDLDLISFSGFAKKSDLLTLPHPRYHERLFVLIPLKDIHPDWFDVTLNLGIDDMISAIDNQALPRLVEVDFCAKSR
jgi:2-amino-4-hydroxy-6-hydroxymethyldihydropteridine diphosphokinase